MNAPWNQNGYFILNIKIKWTALLVNRYQSIWRNSFIRLGSRHMNSPKMFYGLKTDSLAQCFNYKCWDPSIRLTCSVPSVISPKNLKQPKGI